jgi:hypothetical protein
MADNAIAEVKARHEAELLALPSVTGVAIGERDGKPVIKVFVTEKLSQAALAPEERVPTSLEGYDVDVDAIGFIEAEGEQGGSNRDA